MFDNEIKKYSLKNDFIQAEITNVGAALVSLKVRDRYGKMRDVVLGYDDLGNYTENTVYFGAILGRIAGEVRPASFDWNGKKVDLPKDGNGAHLHGGKEGISFKNWDAEIVSETRLRFIVFDKQDQSGYPEDVLFAAEYHLEGNALCLEYSAYAEKATPVNMTAHPYFNLNGHDSGDVSAHELMIDADRYSLTNGEELEKGTVYSASEHDALDFRQGKPVGDREYDLNYILNKKSEYDAELWSKESGIRLRMKCTQPCVQLYNACETDEIGKGGADYGKGSAVCLEPQHFPNFVNIPGAEIPVADAKGSFRHSVRYEFDLK